MTIILEKALAALLGAACVLLAAVPIIITANLAHRLTSRAGLPGTLPWAGVDAKGGKLSRLRANLRSVFHLEALLDEGYTRYSKRGQAYVLPHVLTGPEVVLPLSQARWLVEQPETLLSQTEVNRQFLEADYTFLHPNIVREPVHPEVIRRELTHKLSSFASGIVDELQLCLGENWGLDTENWKEVKVYDTMLDVISRLSTRVFVGQPLCRDKEFLHSARTFDKNVVLPAAALNLLPSFLKPFLAPVATAYDYAQYLTLSKFVLPQIRRRLEPFQQRGEKGVPTSDDGTKPDDYIQWAIDHGLAHRDPAEATATVIAQRLACLCFAAIQSSVISITNTLFDLASSPNCEEHLAVMRDEVITEAALDIQAPVTEETKLTTPVGRADSTDPDSAAGVKHVRRSPSWGKAPLARMAHVDSALRESMRLNGFVARGIMKMVVAPGGVTLPDGSHVPYGTKVGIQAYSVHRDEELYERAETYHPFRFVPSLSGCGANPERMLEGKVLAAGTDSGDKRTPSRERGQRQPQALVTTSPTFLAFSHGPNACPGRFFAANQLKLTLAHIALYYEIEPIATRPTNKWFVGSMAPPLTETLRVRRRKV